MAALNSSSASICPRCGARLREIAKFCPNCAYRLRPDLSPQPEPARPRAPLGQRLLSLGGYLAFASLLLLLALAGIRLFVEEPAPAGRFDLETTVVRLRDLDTIPLGRDSFLPIEGGRSVVGYYDISGENEVPDPDGFLPEPLGAVWVEDDFLLCRHEITNDQYYEFLLARFSRAGAIPQDLVPWGWTRAADQPGVARIYDRERGDDPVTGIPYAAALEFCAWMWERHFGADPEWVVDLPTSREYLRAGRRDSPENWPWGMRFEFDRAHFAGTDPLPVLDPRVGEFHGIFGLLGNAAEWVAYGGDAGLVTCAAGGSFRLNVYDPDRWYHFTRDTTPFVRDGLEEMAPGDRRIDVGFRPVARRAATLPSFARVKGGRVRFERPDGAMVRADPGLPRLPAVPPEGEAEQARDFEIAETEITNRQYQFFLASLAEADPERLYPASGWRRNPLQRAVFRGAFGALERAPFPGQERAPVRNITFEQARAYARWLTARLGDARKRCVLPSAAQYLLAADAPAGAPYPWGSDPFDIELVCAGQSDDEGRPMSLLGKIGPGVRRVLGLCGNVLEYVMAQPDRPLLAGGCFAFPARYCTLRSFVDPQWKSISNGVGLAGAARLERIAQALSPGAGESGPCPPPRLPPRRRGGAAGTLAEMLDELVDRYAEGRQLELDEEEFRSLCGFRVAIEAW